MTENSPVSPFNRSNSVTVLCYSFVAVFGEKFNFVYILCGHGHGITFKAARKKKDFFSFAAILFNLIDK